MFSPKSMSNLGRLTVVGDRERRLNMELDLQSLFWLHVHSRTNWLRPRNSPAYGLIYEGVVGQPRVDTRHLFVTP
jgi:hypothetical protein